VGALHPLFSGELFVDRPAVGAWTARVTVPTSDPPPFRMRAKLERAQPTPKGPPRPLMPNLRMLPPFEFTFTGGLTGVGVFLDSRGPVGGDTSASGCMAEELASYRPTRCLRFSTGPGNVGAGNLELRFQPSATVATGEVTQMVEHTDGSTRPMPAGTYEYHAAHLHFHHAGFAGFELLRVTDERTGAMELAGTGPKLGFCMADYVIVDWRSFKNRREGTVGRNCAGMGDSPAQPMYTGLTRGWADVYAYFQEGMFVDFGDNPDGLYVVRVMGNHQGTINESTQADNASYALIRVTGSEIRVLERGFGTSPWDPKGWVAKDLLPALPPA
jgi:hypothetical protein